MSLSRSVFYIQQYATYTGCVAAYDNAGIIIRHLLEQIVPLNCWSLFAVTPKSLRCRKSMVLGTFHVRNVLDVLLGRSKHLVLHQCISRL
jgi:hypothetical protein